MGVDPARSALMRRIRSKDTKPEVILRRALWASGLRYRLQARAPAGRPDVVFPGPKVAVFIDGCFWHGCPAHYVRPRTRTEFWSDKLRTNVRRDQRISAALCDAGWRVCRLWEHEVYEGLDEVVGFVELAVRGTTWAPGNPWRVVEVVPLDERGEMERRFLEQLYEPIHRLYVEQRRHTRKWKMPR